nr:hypothetical protein [Microbacterium amylolyticum]
MHEHGGEVFAVRRRTDALPSAFDAIAADLGRPLEQELPLVDAMVITLPPAAAQQGYRVALEHLAEGLPARPRRTVFVSSTGVFEGWTGHQPITEDVTPAPSSPRSENLLDGERAAIDLFSAVILRPAGIYGAGREFLIRRVLAGEPISYARRTNRVHESDLVRALAILVGTERPPSVLHAVDQSPAPLGDVAEHISGLLGVARPSRSDGDAVSGNVFDGAAFVSLLGELEYPDFRSGYDAVVRAREVRLAREG